MGWNEITAAWVQAVGSILGIVAAVIIGAATIVAEGRRNRARGQVIALRLSPLLITMHHDIERAKLCIETLANASQPEGQTIGALQGIGLPNGIADEILAETWTLPPRVALLIAELENKLREYQVASQQLQAAGSISYIDKADRDYILVGLRNMLDMADVLALAVSKYCVNVGAKVNRPWWKVFSFGSGSSGSARLP